MGDLSAHFSQSEFQCHHCSKLPKKGIDKRLIDKLELLRSIFSKPVHIRSGYRCPTHNKAVGGATASQHLYGKAADIEIAEIPSNEVAHAAEKIFNGVGRYPNFTHVDVRRCEARWAG